MISGMNVRRGVAIAAALAAICAAGTSPRAQGDDAAVSIPYKTAPQAVRDISPCDIPDSVMRRAFAKGFVFAFRCPGNNANFMQALVYAPREDGTGARVLDFAVPGGRRVAPKEELSNLRWNAETGEVSEIAVDPENRRVCRTEGRWKIPDGGTKPRLVFWRETKDCKGEDGWRVVVGKK